MWRKDVESTDVQIDVESRPIWATREAVLCSFYSVHSTANSIQYSLLGLGESLNLALGIYRRNLHLLVDN